MKDRAPDLVGAALLMVLGAVFAGGTLFRYEIFGEGGRIGPGFMPFSAGLLLVVFGAMVGMGAWMGGRPEVEEAISADYETGGTGDEGSWHTVALVFGLTLVAILLIPLLGFLPSFGILIFMLVRFVEGRGFPLAAGTGVGAVIFAWLVFVFFLRIPLPGGMFVAGG